ncbi:hypothetical protein [Streptomyces sp. CoT10]|uniref:hypothetical protein n=1 Tax=Streptomyces sp. CoT10 TaxID=2875762 RepID=UPI001CD5DE86|nr:hypothetical protein [Streptomyces sp. CoT10]
MPYDLGATARLTAKCREPDGTLADADTAVVTVTLPDGTTATPAVVNPPAQTGQYQADYVTTVAGRHTVRWVFGGPAYAYTDVLDVRPEQPPAILSLADAREHLNYKGSSGTSDDDEIRFWINATTSAVEYFTGPVVVRQVTEDHHVGVVRALALRRPPVLTVTAVEPLLDGGPSYPPDWLNVDGPAGIVTRRDGGLLYGPLRVSYTAGRLLIADNITAAARLILQHLWRTQRPGRSGALAGSSDDYSVTEPISGLGYAIPNRAVQMLDPDRQPPGLA